MLFCISHTIFAYLGNRMSALQRYKCGAVILLSTANLVPQVFRAAEIVTETLYLPLPLSSPSGYHPGENTKEDLLATQNTYTSYLGQLFHDFRQTIPKLDIRLLLPLLPGSSPTPLSQPLEVVVSAYPDVPQTQASPAYRIISRRTPPHPAYHFISDSIQSHTRPFLDSDTWHVGSHAHVAVGGTFDHIHQGHYLLLAATALASSSSCLVGVSDGPLLKDKLLGELLEPLERRCLQVRELLQDMRPGLKLDVVPITDPYGPTITDTALTCLVVSEETFKGGEAVNRKRDAFGMPPMDLYKIPVIAGSNDKLSSSQQRRDMLAVFREQPPTLKSLKQCAPFVIGLTGGTCSGKTSIANYLAGKGAFVIDCDKLGYDAYRPGTPTFDMVVASFGSCILDPNGVVDRKVLGSIVFSDPEKLDLLNQIVWPAIGALLQESIATALQAGARVCVADAAVLLEAGWEEFVDEVWVAFVPEQQAIVRLMERNGLQEEVARKRISAQFSNEKKLARANLFICSLWDHETTRTQVDSAWDSMQERILKTFYQ